MRFVFCFLDLKLLLIINFNSSIFYIQNIMEQKYPLVVYSNSDLKEKALARKLKLDQVVLSRWDMFMQKGHFR